MTEKLQIHAISLAALALISVLALLGSAAAHAAPCPPALAGDSTHPAGEACPSRIRNDASYGPVQISGGMCPNVPTSFPRVHTVASSAEFDTAYAAVKPGEAIVVQNGSYSGGSSLKTLTRHGTASAPIYILSQSLHGAEFRDSFLRFHVKGSRHVIAGFKWTNPGSGSIITVDGPDNRIACNVAHSNSAKGMFLLTNSLGLADRLEVDNNVLSGLFRGMRFHRCNPTLSSCTKNSMGIHVHHNTFRDVPADPDPSVDREAILLGLGYHAVDGVRTYNANGNDMGMIVENNLFDGWNGEEELISIKSSRNIIRNNCVRNAPGTYMVIRLGDNNLITGNWQEGGRGGHRISGTGNYFVFNYQAKRTNGSHALRPHQGSRSGDLYVYRQASDNVWRYNVFGNFNGWIQVRDRIGSVYVDSPRRNIFSDNLMYSTSFVGDDTRGSGSYSNVDGTWTETQYRNANTWNPNSVIPSKLPESECGNPALFSGPGGQSAMVPGRSQLLDPSDIRPPSWW
ncbi:MAG: chondroitinase-B domain-containing protein [Pseudomonadales bacterium]